MPSASTAISVIWWWCFVVILVDFELASYLQKAVTMIEPLLDPLHPAHEEFKKRGLEQLALVNGVNYTDLDQRRCPICQGTGHLGKKRKKPKRERKRRGEEDKQVIEQETASSSSSHLCFSFSSSLSVLLSAYEYV